MSSTFYKKKTVLERKHGTMQESIVFPAGSREDFLGVHRQPHSLYEDHAVRLAGISTLPAGYSVQRRHAEDHLLLFALSPGLQLESPKKAFLKPGDLLSAPRDSTYRYRTTSRCKFLWFHFMSDPHWNHLLQHAVRIRKALYTEEIKMLALGHLAESDRHQVDRHFFCEGYESLLVAYWERELRTNQSADEFAKMQQLHSVWAKVKEDPSRDWTTEILSQLSGFSESTLHRLTWKLQHSTPQDMVRKARMERAAALLSRGALIQDAVASQVGYGNAFSFSRAFKKHFGISPKQFRGRSPAGVAKKYLEGLGNKQGGDPRPKEDRKPENREKGMPGEK
jgi:AraC-like DNA-binding protein